VSRKAVHQLIATVDGLKQERVRLLIIGAGPEERHLRAEAAKREVGNRILFMGQVDEAEKFRILHMCDLYVSTSQHEGFGLVFLEAMACGLPIVCYDHGGQTDFLRDGENGCVVPLNRIDLFREKCRALIENGSLRKMIGESNQRAVEEYYIDRCAATYEEIFATACKQSTR
jgi:glycosyltransferase involved in cell wall biosynthesis